jgi:hypothetical protein
LLANIVLAYYSSLFSSNETLPIINKPKDPKKGEYKEQNGRTQKRGNTRNKMEGPMSKKTKENHLRGQNHKGKHQVPNIHKSRDPTPTKLMPVPK